MPFVPEPSRDAGETGHQRRAERVGQEHRQVEPRPPQPPQHRECALPELSRPVVEEDPLVEPVGAVERRRHLRPDDGRELAPGNPRRKARNIGVAMTVSPIRFGQKTAIFMPGPLPMCGARRGPSWAGAYAMGGVAANPFALTATPRRPAQSGRRFIQEPGQCVFHDVFTRHDLEPDLEGSQRGRTQVGAAKLHQILLSGQDEIGAQLPRPGRQRLHVGQGIVVMIGEDAEIERASGRGAGASAGIPRDCRCRRRPRPSDRPAHRAACPAPRNPPGRAGRDGLRPIAADPRDVRPRRGWPLDPPGRPGRPGDRTHHVRHAAATPTGSRSRPRGSSRPRPNGSRASISTRSRSRASRRCWKPSSRTSSSASSSSTATRADRTRSASWRWGTSGRFSSSTRPSSFRPCDLAVAPAQDDDPLGRVGDTSGPPTRPSASCRCPRPSGCRPRRPGRRPDAPRSQPRS